LISFKNKLTNDEAEETAGGVVVIVDDESVLDSIQSKILSFYCKQNSLMDSRLKSINSCVFGRKIIFGLDSVLCVRIVNKTYS
jgi:hypothetical protein